MRRPLVVTAAVLLVLVSVGILGFELGQWKRPPPEVLASVTDDEACLIASINAERAKVRAAPLSVNPALTAYARNHSDAMAAAGDIFHSGGSVSNPEPGAQAFRRALGSPWNTYPKVGENVGDAPDCESMMYGIPRPAGYTGPPLFTGYMGSPPHRANILDPVWTEMGVGVSYDPSGQLYSTEVFVRDPPWVVPAQAMPSAKVPSATGSAPKVLSPVPPRSSPSSPVIPVPLEKVAAGRTVVPPSQVPPPVHTDAPEPKKWHPPACAVFGTVLASLGLGAVLVSVWLWLGSSRGRKAGGS
jgi:uncharacterized protein YkwD